jgi:hypothetical protein
LLYLREYMRGGRYVLDVVCHVLDFVCDVLEDQLVTPQLMFFGCLLGCLLRMFASDVCSRFFALAMSTSRTLRLREGERYKNAAAFKPFVRECASGFLMRTTFKSRDALTAALEAVDPGSKKWGRARVNYQLAAAKKSMMAETTAATGRTRPAEISPTDADLTEGFGLGLANLRTIAVCGLVPFTRVLLEHPEVVAGSTARVEGREAATDAAAAAAGDVNLGALNLEGLRRLSMDAKAKREAASRRYHGMELPDDDLALADLGEDGAALVRRMDGVKAKWGAMFAAAETAGDLDGLEFTAGAVRAVAERIAKEQGEKAQKAEADAKLRAAVADTNAGRAAAAAGRGRGRGGKGGRGRMSWKKAAADLSEQGAAAKEAFEAQIRELKAQLAAAQPPVVP